MQILYLTHALMVSQTWMQKKKKPVIYQTKGALRDMFPFSFLPSHQQLVKAVPEIPP